MNKNANKKKKKKKKKNFQKMFLNKLTLPIDLCCSLLATMPLYQLLSPYFWNLSFYTPNF